MGRHGLSDASKATALTAVSLFADDLGNERGLDVKEASAIMIKVTPAAEDLTAFAVKVKVHQNDADWLTVRNLAAHYTAPSGIVFETGLSSGASPDLTTIAAGVTGWIIIDVRGFAKLEIDVIAAGVGTIAYSAFGHLN